MKKPELLSPAGNFDALKGAINAGADAVYLGGELYGARAYADNFTQDEILEGLYLAHLFGRKIYLTVNTLVKEKELDGLYGFLMPFYEKGLDGVIVQDLGVLRYIRSHFPSLPIHASTQMTITGCFGAELMKEEGVSRIVPARELSLEEIRKIRKKTGLEIETFIHGAMCYCYSGQCLFSSILGGRSGNRGRCAQPCRLPYKVDGGKQEYSLSMKDMCTLNLLPELIDAGIDSFKIEGRMKKPAYAAGVTAIYRKYIDMYEKERENYRVDKKDLEVLNTLYIRSERSDGYYHRTNGREMISISSPAYLPTDEELLSSIENRYIDKKPEIMAWAKISLKAGKTAELTLQTDGMKAAFTTQESLADNAFEMQRQTVTVTCRGDLVQKAVNQPLSLSKIREQIQKSGNSFIKIEQVEAETPEPVFLPVKALNELRRKAVEKLEAAIIAENIRENRVAECRQKIVMPKSVFQEGRETFLSGKISKDVSERENKNQLHISVQTIDQLEAAMETEISRIYLEYSLLSGEVFDKLKKYKKFAEESKRSFPEIYVSTPYIVRENNIGQLEILTEAFGQGKIDGILVRNLESFRFLSKQVSGERLTIDTGLYVWNREAVLFWERRAAECYLPLEERWEEWKELLKAQPGRTIKVSAVIYGRLPLMITANCLKKTSEKCDNMPGILTLTDRYEKHFPVYTDCRSCYNVIYNSVPLSLHGMFTRKNAGGLCGSFRLDFTVENKRETLKVIRYFQALCADYREPFYKEYTTGHYKRGVE